MANRLLNKFKEPIYKSDLHKVIKSNLFGPLFALGFGMLFFFANQLNSIMGNFKIDFITLFSLVIAFLLARKVASNHNSGHIVYKLLSVFVWIISYWVLSASGYIFEMTIYSIFYKENFVLSLLPLFINPLSPTSFGWIWRLPILLVKSFSFIGLLNYLLQLLMFIYAIVFVYRNSSRV